MENLGSYWIKLTDAGMVKRKPRRPSKLQQSDFSEKFDYETLFYDYFIKKNSLYFIGPFISDQDANYLISLISINGISLDKLKFKIYKTKKVFKIIVDNFNINYSLMVGSLNLNPRVVLPYLDGKKVAYTLQKNNDIIWIADWIYEINRIHGIEDFLIYDNLSDKYNLEEISLIASRLKVNLSIVSVPYLHGPRSYNLNGVTSDWDSDFLQSAMFEHARYRFFDNSGILLNSDIDELIFFPSLVDDLIKSDVAAFTYSGRWAYISSKQKDAAVKGIIRHRDHNLIDLNVVCSNKWIVNLALLRDEAFLAVHGIINLTNQVKINNYFCHFSGISDGWKYKRDYLSPGGEGFVDLNCFDC